MVRTVFVIWFPGLEHVKEEAIFNVTYNDHITQWLEYSCCICKIGTFSACLKTYLAIEEQTPKCGKFTIKSNSFFIFRSKQMDKTLSS